MSSNSPEAVHVPAVPFAAKNIAEYSSGIANGEDQTMIQSLQLLRPSSN
jgi:hypothetical protein